MPIILVGLNHRTAPIELREQFSLSGDRLYTLLQALNSAQHTHPADAEPPSTAADTPGCVHETVILSTCNRLEVYATVEKARHGWTTVQRLLAQLLNILPEHLVSHLYYFAGQTAAKHLMRVAAGLDSLILGEAQILGQVSRACSAAQDAGTAGPVLSRLFMHAVHAGKRAHSDTARRPRPGDRRW
jgi:glutamyl-tRNA reductase